jgi:hypothetical protein
MTYSKNLFFSEDEIEAVDMEIETLLLAKKRQERKQYPVEPYATPDNVQPSVAKPAASRPVREASTPVSSSNTIPNSSGVLPQQRLTNTEVVKERQTFRINKDGETILWPELEPRTGQGRLASKAQRLNSRRRGIIGLALLIAVSALMIAGYAIWVSGIRFGVSVL